MHDVADQLQRDHGQTCEQIKYRPDRLVDRNNPVTLSLVLLVLPLFG